MKIICNSITDLKAIGDYAGFTVNTSELEISFPHHLELRTLKGEQLTEETITMEEFKKRYNEKTNV
jgi:hypothetical protein